MNNITDTHSSKVILRIRKQKTPGGANMRGRYALSIQVVWMDERFRFLSSRVGKATYEHPVALPDGRTFTVASMGSPELGKDRFNLWGRCGYKDINMCSRYFSSETKREKYLADVLYAIRDWSASWPGWNTIAAATPSRTVEILSI